MNICKCIHKYNIYMLICVFVYMSKCTLKCITGTFNTSMAWIGLIDKDREWYMARDGLESIQVRLWMNGWCVWMNGVYERMVCMGVVHGARWTREHPGVRVWIHDHMNMLSDEYIIIWIVCILSSSMCKNEWCVWVYGVQEWMVCMSVWCVRMNGVYECMVCKNEWCVW